jgi:thermostable 8-oxoguanine DNA glycosylase
MNYIQETFKFLDEIESKIKKRTEKRVIQPTVTRVEDFFNSFNRDRVAEYCEYWTNISPKTEMDCLRRWLFAFLSVHTTWERNVIAYNRMKDLNWIGDDVELENRLVAAGVGLHKNRTKFLSRFVADFLQNTSDFFVKNTGDTKQSRDSLVKRILGLGMAKTSFALEMIQPTTCEAVCMDTHLFQLYGLDQSKDLKFYKTIENHWNDMCVKHEIPNYIARCLFWDTNQEKNNSRYWSWCLE